MEGRNLDLASPAAVCGSGACVNLVSWSQLRDSLGVDDQSTVVHTRNVLCGELMSSPCPDRDLEKISVGPLGRLAATGAATTATATSALTTAITSRWTQEE